MKIIGNIYSYNNVNDKNKTKIPNQFSLPHSLSNDIFVKNDTSTVNFGSNTAYRILNKASKKISLLGRAKIALKNTENRIFMPDPRPNIIENIKETYPTVYSKVKERTITTADGIKLNCWDVPPEEGMPYVFYCHGLKKRLANDAEPMELLAKHGYGVFGIEYRGYAGNPGISSQKNHLLDTTAAMKYLINEKQIPPENIGLFGVSMGGAIAIDLAAKFKKLRYLIVMSSFTKTAAMCKEFVKGGANNLKSIPQGMRKLFNYVPADAIPVNNDYNSLKTIKKITNFPILFVHTEGDKVIPTWMPRELAKTASKNNPDVTLCITEKGSHLSINDKAPAILSFIKKNK